MYSFKIATLAVVALGLVSGRNLQGSSECHFIKCNLITMDSKCIPLAVQSVSGRYGGGGVVSTNTVTFVTKAKVQPGVIKVDCAEDRNTKVECTQGANTKCSDNFGVDGKPTGNTGVSPPHL